MNVFKKVVAMSVLSLSTVVSSQAVELRAADKTSFTQLCMTAVSGNRAATHNAIKESGYSKNFVINNVQCNSKDMITFIQQYGNNVESMVNALDKQGTHVTIKDLAMLSRKYN